MPPPDLPDLSGLTLLVVDDNDDSLDMLGTFLRTCGARVFQARNQRPSLLAIAMTGFYENYMDTRSAAFDAFLRKPVNLDELCRVIRSAVRPR